MIILMDDVKQEMKQNVFHITDGTNMYLSKFACLICLKYLLHRSYIYAIKKVGLLICQLIVITAAYPLSRLQI